MGRYTVTINDLLENDFNLGLDSYPIYKEDHREELNKKIIEHYRFYEIGFETPARFKWELNKKLNEIMPYYNQLYKSEEVEFNPLYNIEIIETFEQNSSSKAEHNENGSSLSMENDTPASQITEEEINNNNYISQYSKDKINNTNTTQGENVNNYTKKTEGSSAGLPFSKAIKQWREIMVNIDMKVIKELEPLFIQIY